MIQGDTAHLNWLWRVLSLKLYNTAVVSHCCWLVASCYGDSANTLQSEFGMNKIPWGFFLGCFSTSLCFTLWLGLFQSLPYIRMNQCNTHHWSESGFFQNLKKTKLFMALKFQLEKTLTCFWRELVIMFREQHTRWKKDVKCHLHWYQVAAFWKESALNLGSRSKFSSPLALTGFLKLAAFVAPKANVVVTVSC